MPVVFNIQRFSVQDGPGIRTTVFLKGCPLRCLWCSNPESQNAFPEVVHRDSLCNGCGKCVEVCEARAISLAAAGVSINRKKCTGCAQCIDVCVPKALHLYGKEMTVDEVFDEVLRDKPFYENSEGGVTVSGGEPLSQADFVAGLLERCQRARIHTCIETCGYADSRDWESVLPHTDLVLFDLKLMDAAAHRKVTGTSNEKVLNSLKRVTAAGVPVIVRIPVIPGINDSEDNLRAIARHVRSLDGVQEVHLLPYHRYGEGKYQSLDREYQLGSLIPPDDARLEELANLFKDMNVSARIVK